MPRGITSNQVQGHIWWRPLRSIPGVASKLDRPTKRAGTAAAKTVTKLMRVSTSTNVRGSPGVTLKSIDRSKGAQAAG